MQTWSQVKSDKKPPSMNELIEEMLKAQKAGGKDIFEERQNAEALEKKLAAKRERNEAREKKKEAESKDSYLTLKQFDFIYDRIQTARKSLKAQQEVIDKMETKMIGVIDKRQELVRGIILGAGLGQTWLIRAAAAILKLGYNY